MKTRLEEVNDLIDESRDEIWKLAGWSETWTKLKIAIENRIKLEIEKDKILASAMQKKSCIRFKLTKTKDII